MMKKYFGLIALVLFLMVSCSSNKKQIEFAGEMGALSESKIELYKVLSDDEILINSSPIKNGKFKIVAFIDEKDTLPSFYKLVLDKTNYLLTVASPGEKLYFNIDSLIMVKSYHVKGGNDAMLMNQLNNQLNHFIDSVLVLEKTYKNYQYNDSVKSMIESTYLGYVKNHTQFLVNFIHKNPTSLATLTAFYQKFNRRAFLPEEENIALLKEIATQLEQKYPNHKDINYIKSRIENSLNEK